MLGRDKERGRLSEERKENLQDLFLRCESLLNDYIEEIPIEIVSANQILIDGKTISFGESARYKCQISWFQRVLNAIMRITREFPSDKDLGEKYKAYEASIINRQKIPQEENPQLFIDSTGRPHILTTREEIHEGNEILEFIIKKLKSELGE
jgi:hypothetical protein